jgi:hypothetical protein
VTAYLTRDKVRDLYDVLFIALEHQDELSEGSKSQLINAFQYKGLGQLDYLLATQEDALVNTDRMETRFLEMYESLDLVSPSDGYHEVEETANAGQALDQDVTTCTKASRASNVDSGEYEPPVI